MLSTNFVMILLLVGFCTGWVLITKYVPTTNGRLPRKLYAALGLGTPHLDEAIREGYVKEGCTPSKQGFFAIAPGFFPKRGLVMEELRQIVEIQLKRATVDGLVCGLIFSAIMMFFMFRTMTAGVS